MRKIFFLVIVLFAMQHLSAQKFVLMKDTAWIESKDSCVYRVEGYDQLISKEKFRHYIVIRSRSLESAWLDWLSWSVLPQEILLFSALQGREFVLEAWQFLCVCPLPEFCR